MVWKVIVFNIKLGLISDRTELRSKIPTFGILLQVFKSAMEFAVGGVVKAPAPAVAVPVHWIWNPPFPTGLSIAM